MNTPKFQPTGNGNELAAGEGFWVSYNPNTGSGRYAMLTEKLTQVANLILSTATKHQLKDGEETALCRGNEYYILEGDFRKEYLRLIDKGFEVCYKFYLAHAEFKSQWSTDNNLFDKKNEYTHYDKNRVDRAKSTPADRGILGVRGGFETSLILRRLGIRGVGKP